MDIFGFPWYLVIVGCLGVFVYTMAESQRFEHAEFLKGIGAFFAMATILYVFWTNCGMARVFFVLLLLFCAIIFKVGCKTFITTKQ